MKKFQRRLNHTDVKYKLLSVSSFRDELPPRGEEIIVIDEDEREYQGKMHNRAARIDGLSKWYNNHSVEENDLVIIEVDPKDNTKIKFYPDETQSSTQTQVVEEQEEKIEIVPALENQLEEFLSKNLNKIERGLSLYEDEDGVDGRQYSTDVGIIDLLCVDKNNDFVIIELKKGKGSDKVIGQITRYMGWVDENLAGDNKVKGLVIVHESNDKLKYSASVNDKINIKHYKIELKFINN